MAKYTTETDVLFQYSQGYRLRVPNAYKTCHTQFYSAHYTSGLTIAPASYITEGSNVYCPIPNQMLVYADTIIVYAYLLDTDRAITESKTVLPVWERPQPPDWVLDPTDTETYETVAELITDMNNALTKISTVSASAESSETATATATLGTDSLTFEFGLPKGEKGDTGDTGEKGDKGDTGDKGDKGDTSTITVGTVETSETASVVNVGTNTDAIFNFGLPRGEKGNTGDKGDTGDTGNGISKIELIDGSHVAGTYDTYRITYTDSSTYNFQIYNGSNGTGSGDMSWSDWNTRFDASGKQGQMAFADEIPDVPTALSELTDDATHRLVTDTEKTAWNAKSDFSGSYNDLTNKPTIPDELSDLTDDSTHRVVTDTEKATWNAKQNALVADTDYLTPGTAGTTYEKKASTVTSTISASGWSDGSYSFESTYPAASYDISVELDGDSATDDQIEAWSSAKMIGSAASNVLYAKGDTPTEDLPVIIKVVAK